jgi:hypothetical protein
MLGVVMGLKEDAKTIVSGLLGPDVAKQLDSFEDPKKYPKDFINECVHFLGHFIGENVSKEKFEPLYAKYG